MTIVPNLNNAPISPVTPLVDPHNPSKDELERDFYESNTHGTIIDVSVIAGLAQVAKTGLYSDLIGGYNENVLPTDLQRITPYMFGCKGDFVHVQDCSMASGSSTVTANVGTPFKASHVGAVASICVYDPSGNIHVGTVTGYISPTQITVSFTAAYPYNNMRFIVGHDDTTGLQAALDYCAGKGLTVDLSNGKFLCGPLTIGKRTTVKASGRDSGGLYLKPGSATTNKYLVKNKTTTDYHQIFKDMHLNGLRDFQVRAYVLPTDIDTLVYVGSGDTEIVDVYNVYDNLRITETCRAALKYYGKGESKFTKLTISGANIGVDFNAFDCSMSDCNSTAYGPAFMLGSSTSSCRFSNCKGFFSGYIFTGTFGDGMKACWFLNGASYNTFNACEGQESFGSTLYLNDAKRNLFCGFVAVDPGCISTAVHGVTTTSDRPTYYSAIEIQGASEQNAFYPARAGARVHGTNWYATQFVIIGGTSTNNWGQILVDSDIFWDTGGFVRNTSSGSNDTLHIN